MKSQWTGFRSPLGPGIEAFLTSAWRILATVQSQVCSARFEPLCDLASGPRMR